MGSVLYVVGHRNPDADSVCSAIAYAHLERSAGDGAVGDGVARDVRPARAGELDAETAFVLRHFDVPVPELLTDAAGLDLVLVDHNEVEQALPHIERANIVAVWEHHRIGNLPLPRPILFHCEPVGATATLIAEAYFLRGVEPTRAMAGILLAAILSDTAVFRSPTVSAKDRAMAAKLAPLAGVDATAFGEQMLAVRTAATEQRSAVELVRDDLKQFVFGGRRVGIAQVAVAHPELIAARKAEILREMRTLREEAGLADMILMVTDAAARASDLWFVGERRAPFEAVFGRLEDDAVHVPGCMSRKTQVVPQLETAFAQQT